MKCRRGLVAWVAVMALALAAAQIGGAAASVTSPVLGMNGSGVAVAAWYYDIASPDIYANVSR